MTNAEIAVFLEDTRVKIQNAIDDKFRPVYKSNTWLKQKDLHPTERILMQLIDEINDEFTNKQLADLTGLSRKCVRENLDKLCDKKFIKRIEGTRRYETIRIY
jgi:DNA phosphorothioation-dependent restriction protein DptG